MQRRQSGTQCNATEMNPKGRDPGEKKGARMRAALGCTDSAKWQALRNRGACIWAETNRRGDLGRRTVEKGVARGQMKCKLYAKSCKAARQG